MPRRRRIGKVGCNGRRSVSSLDTVWDFDDPAGSEARFRELLTNARGDDRLEILTQIARAEGLQRRFADAHRTLDDIAEDAGRASRRVAARYLLERGRVLRSEGSRAPAAAQFAAAMDRAVEAHEPGLAVDAVHMLAITVLEPSERMAWHERGIAMAEASDDPAARRWLPSLRNNLGWSLFEAGRYEEALAQFESAAAGRRAQDDAKATRIADWAVARALRALGRVGEALEIQLRLLDEWRAAGGRPPFAHEEAGECRLLRGREREAQQHFRTAYELFSADAAFAASEPERLARLERLASPPSTGS